VRGRYCVRVAKIIIHSTTVGSFFALSCVVIGCVGRGHGMCGHVSRIGASVECCGFTLKERAPRPTLHLSLHRDLSSSLCDFFLLYFGLMSLARAVSVQPPRQPHLAPRPSSTLPSSLPCCCGFGRHCAQCAEHIQALPWPRVLRAMMADISSSLAMMPSIHDKLYGICVLRTRCLQPIIPL
jgi:hypothetical protein